MGLALVGMPGADLDPAWTTSDVSGEDAIRGFEGVTLMLDDAAPTGAILTDVLGFRETDRDGALIRYTADAAVGGTSISGPRRASCPAGWAEARCTTWPFVPRTMRPRPRWSSVWPRTTISTHGAEGPQLLPVRLFPRARRHPVRDRHRRPGLRGG